MNPADMISATPASTTTQQQSAACAEGFQDTLKQAVDQAVEQAVKERESTEILPVEAYSLPDWYVDLIPEQSILTPCINHEYWAQAQAFSADGSLSAEEKAALKTMRDNDQQRKTEMANRAWRQEHRQELAEYMDTLHGYFVESLRERGIDEPEEYYRQVVLNGGSSERVRQGVAERLAGNPRALKLMEMLGIGFQADA